MSSFSIIPNCSSHLLRSCILYTKSAHHLVSTPLNRHATRVPWLICKCYSKICYIHYLWDQTAMYRYFTDIRTLCLICILLYQTLSPPSSLDILACFPCCTFNSLLTATYIKQCTFIHSFIHSFYWHVQNATIPCHSQEPLPFHSVMYIFLPPFSTNYSSIHPHLILPSISWSTSQSCCSQIHI